MRQLILLGMASFSVLLGCTEQVDQPSQEAPLRYVRTLEVNQAGNNLFRELPGVVAANREAELSFRIAGKVVELSVKEGDSVTKGQLLASLDDADINIQLKSAQAAFNKAQADFTRGQALVGNGTISQAEYNQLESALAAAEATLESTKQNILYTTLKAPFDGIIAKRNIDNFEEVQAKQSIFVLQDVSSIDIKVDIPESIMILTSEDTRPDVVAMFDAIPDKMFPLTMKEIATQADKETNTYEVTMSMPKVEGYNILPGMSVTARATQQVGQGNTASSSIFVPAHAVLEDTDGRYVFIARATTPGKANVERRSVVTGSLNSLGLEIVSGLETGERLIVAGMSKMYDGLEVRLVQE
ncbi:efflux RND transporter periplasmic adaptor subunit [Alteromonas sediminis]|nr:efflux RND transporter periplasmic adaptor subunit [Alteromonas sediminis]